MDGYDVIIVGAGPAGIFAALELSKVKGIRTLMLDSGADVDTRACPVSKSQKRCIECAPCNTLCGWGGAGAFSDGKLHLKMTGGFLYRNRHRKGLIDDIIEYVDRTYRDFGAPDRVYDPSREEIFELQKEAARYGLRLVPSRIRHMGTEVCLEVLKGLRDELGRMVEIRCDTPVERLVVESGRCIGVETTDGEFIGGGYILIAPGRAGASWLKREAERLGIETSNNALDIGVRVEVPYSVISRLTELLYEPKIVYGGKGFKDKVRTFCVCPMGEVVQEYTDGVITVNGHSFASKKTENTNFAVLMSVDLDSDIDPLDFGRDIASSVNKGVGGVLVQRLGDLRSGLASSHKGIKDNKVRPTLREAEPGDISIFMPYRYLKGILEMIDALDMFFKGVGSPDTLIYGMEGKFYSKRLPLDEECESEIENLFGAGDGVGVSRGLVQASVSGVLAARGIIKKMGR